MFEVAYKRLERIILIAIMVGIVAMFQPWFTAMVGLFEPLAPEARLGRTYTREIAPIIFRYGFYITFLSTIAFIVISHYSVEDLETAVRKKGTILTILLIALPVIFGFSMLGELSRAHHTAALLHVANFVFAVAIWNGKRWGVIGLGLAALAGLGLALTGEAILPLAAALLIAVLTTVMLSWSKRHLFA